MIFFTATPYRTDGELITESIRTHGFAYKLEDKAAVERGIIRPVQFTENPCDPKDSVDQNHYIEAVVAKVIERMLSKDTECPLPDKAPHCAM